VRTPIPRCSITHWFFIDDRLLISQTRLSLTPQYLTRTVVHSGRWDRDRIKEGRLSLRDDGKIGESCAFGSRQFAYESPQGGQPAGLGVTLASLFPDALFEAAHPFGRTGIVPNEGVEEHRDPSMFYTLRGLRALRALRALRG